MKLQRHGLAYQESPPLTKHRAISIYSPIELLEIEKTHKTYTEVKFFEEKICANIEYCRLLSMTVHL